MAATLRRPRGRPHTLETTVTTTDGEMPITDAIIDLIRRTGVRPDVAAAKFGLERSMVLQWLRDGWRASNRTTNTEGPKLTANELRLIDFAQRSVAAAAEWHTAMRQTLQALADGGIEQVVITETTDAEGNVTRSERRTNAMPDPKVLVKLLEVTIPETYHLPTVVEHLVTVDDPGGLKAPGSGLVDALAAALDRRKESLAALPEGSIDVTSRDV